MKNIKITFFMSTLWWCTPATCMGKKPTPGASVWPPGTSRALIAAHSAPRQVSALAKTAQSSAPKAVEPETTYIITNIMRRGPEYDLASIATNPKTFLYSLLNSDPLNKRPK